MSAIGLGCNNFGRAGTVTEHQEGTTAVIRAAVDAGITLLDTADIYGGADSNSERLMGVALQGVRDEVVLATKFGHSGVDLPGTEQWGPKGARRYIRNAIDASLTRLQTDRIDLFQLHTPDPETPIADTVDALDELVDEGKILAYGHSNLDAEQIDAAAAVASEHGFSTAQNEYSLLERSVERDVLPAVARAGLGFLPFFPLANGLLTGKYTVTSRPAGRLTDLKPQLLEGVDWTQLEEFQAIADRHGLTMLEATFAWLLAQPTVTSVIAGATSPRQVAQNAAAGEATLPATAVQEIAELFA